MIEDLLPHLVELRTRLLRYVLVLVLALALCAWQAPTLFAWLSHPLRVALGPHATMIYTAPYEAFFTYLRVAIFFSFFLTFPWLLTELWGFIVPGLYERERRLFTPILLAGGILFYAGGLFAYLGVFPFAFKYFFSFTTAQITPMPSLKESLTLFMRMLFAFGVAFEMPLVLLMLMHFGIITAKSLRKNRGYVVLVVFILAAVLTPPDVITQFMLALPMILLFELTLVAERFLRKRKAQLDEEATPDEGAQG